MNNQNPADGTYVFVKTQTLPPSTIPNFQDNTKGFTDEAILNSIRYVPQDSPEIPVNVSSALEGVNLNQIPGMQCRVAIWPDKVCAVLCFPETMRKPRKLQLLRAYRNARHAKRAIEFHDQNAQGRSA